MTGRRNDVNAIAIANQSSQSRTVPRYDLSFASFYGTRNRQVTATRLRLIKGDLMATGTTTAAKSKSVGDRAEIVKMFKRLVNMTPSQMEKFLTTDNSKRVGFKKTGAGESVGHRSGRRIIEIKVKKSADLSDDDVKHMRKVIGYIKRHCEQGPHHQADVRESKWRYSLMNWGHDPMK